VAAIAAAVAAAASWGTVWQGRRERLAAQTPDLHIHTMFRAADRVIRVMLVNNGGLARNVAFHIWEGSGVVSGIPGPTATFLPGESRLYDTDLKSIPDEATKAIVFCENLDRSRVYARAEGQSVRVYRLKGWRRMRRPFVADTVVEEIYPGALARGQIREGFRLVKPEE
jgi:hypothetical protein